MLFRSVSQSRYIQKVQEVAQSVMFVSPGLDEVGFIWVRGKGVKMLDEPWEQAA